MTDREKLIDLIYEGKRKRADICSDCEDCSLCERDADGDNCGDGIIADHLLANGVVVREWIPVTERLPNLHTDVLVYRRNHCGFSGYMGIEYVTLGHGESRMWSNDFTTYKSAVTHWMPLPEPPMRKGENG